MKFITRVDLKNRGIQFSNKHLLSLEKRGVFPRRVRLGDRSVAWVQEEIEAYQAAIAAARSEREAQYAAA